MAPKFDQTVRCDVLVIGGGEAGCNAAIAAKEAGIDNVVIAEKAMVGKSGMSPFGAGVSSFFDPAEDDFDVWMQEMVENGEYLNNQEWVKIMITNSLPIHKRIQEWSNGRAYEITPDGKFLRRRARGHIRCWTGVQNSLIVMDTLRRKALSIGVTFVERVMVTDFVTDGSKVVGVIGLSYRDNKTYLFLSKAVIVAAAGTAFKQGLDAQQNLTGDLQAAAFDAGATFCGMASLATNVGAKNFRVHGMNLYVSAGGKYVNKNGEDFLWEYDPILGTRAGFHCLAKAFCFENEAGRGPMYLDLSPVSPEDQALIRKVLPQPFKVYEKAGIDPFKEKIEWVPAFTGTNAGGGGIRINTKCETNLEGLYAAGDSSNSPHQGMYTFGGNNLAFAAVSGEVAGKSAAEFARRNGPLKKPGRNILNSAGEAFLQKMHPITRHKGILPDEATLEVQRTIIPAKYSTIRSRDSLEEAQNKIKTLQEELPKKLMAKDTHELVKAIGVISMLKIARLSIEAGLVREESRGSHYRKDFPMTDNVNWLKWILLQRDGDGIKTWTEPVPTPYVKPKEDYSIPPGVARK